MATRSWCVSSLKWRMATVKTFRQEGNLVILTPRSSNPVHQPQVYDLKKTPVQVLGRVIECRKVY